MKQQYRKTLKAKMQKSLSQEIKRLPKNTQEILIDDLVTAFENRLRFFEKNQSMVELEVISGLEVSQEA